MKTPSLSTAEKVAQLFMVGSDSPQLADELEPFYRMGAGGLLLFRHHLQPFSAAPELKEFLTQERQRFHRGALSFIGIDQEGGQVERLPHWLFPTGVLPVALGMGHEPLLCEQINREVARRLRWLGFNLNFTPTVDLNTEMMNPIIGVRAYGNTADTVLPFAQAVIHTHQEAGVLPVAKHFPGHGSGTVDSHLDLPTFEAWEETELRPYEVLIRDNLPAVLVAHGLYPRLFKQLGADPRVPASLSKAVVTHLLREKLGFGGLVFTDDLTMGAVWHNADPVEVATQALMAGADMLVYRRAQPEAWQVYEHLLSRVKQGKFPENLVDEKVTRILQVKEALEKVPVFDYPEVSVSQEACEALSLQWASNAMIELKHTFISPLPLSHHTPWVLAAPDRETMRHYQPDSQRGKGLDAWLKHYGLEPRAACFYAASGEKEDTQPTWPDAPIEVIVFIAFNSHLHPSQQNLYRQLKSRYPQAKCILASCGMPTDREVLPSPWVHVQLPSFRPAALQAFVQWLITTPKQSDLTSHGQLQTPD